jgi:hypothetical protein
MIASEISLIHKNPRRLKPRGLRVFLRYVWNCGRSLHEPLPAIRTPAQGRYRRFKIRHLPSEPNNLSPQRHDNHPDLPPGSSRNRRLDHRFQLRQ